VVGEEKVIEGYREKVRSTFRKDDKRLRKTVVFRERSLSFLKTRPLDAFHDIRVRNYCFFLRPPQTVGYLLFYDGRKRST